MYFVLLWALAITCGSLGANEDFKTSRQYIPVTPTKHCKCNENYYEWLKGGNPEEARTIYYDKRVPTNLIPNWIFEAQNQFENNVISTFSKIKRQNSFHSHSNGETDSIHESEYIPLYMDISISSRSDNEASRFKDLYRNKVKELTENNIKDCLDLNYILHARNEGVRIQGDIISKINEIYNYISDDDLVVEINNKCKQLAIAVAESVHEAISKRPHSSHPDIISHRSFDDKGTTVHYNSLAMNTFQNSVNDLNNFEVSTSNLNLESNTAEANKMDKEIVTEIVHGSSEMICCKHDATSTLSPTETTELAVSLIAENTTLEFIPNPTTLDLKNKTIYSDVMITPLTASKFDFTMTPNIEIQSKYTEDTTTFVTAPLNDDQFESDEQVEEIIDTINKEQLQEESNRKLDNDGFKGIGDAINRKEYLEGEYEINKVVTIEFSNDTIISEIQGNEEIPNLDFVSPEHALPKEIFKQTDIPAHENKSPVLINSSADIEIVNSRKINEIKNITEDNIISGKLYFKYGTEYIPASFLQQPNGQVDVAFDILSLCESYTNENISLLIQAMCNCIRN